MQLQSLPSAPPLPEGHTHVPQHAPSSSCQDQMGDLSQPVPYPALHGALPVGNPYSQNFQREECTSQHRGHATRAEGRTPGGEDTMAGNCRAHADSADGQAAGSLAWAMQAAAGASSAVASVLSTWLPWGQHDSSSHSNARRQPRLQQTSSAAPCTAPSNGR